MEEAGAVTGAVIVVADDLSVFRVSGPGGSRVRILRVVVVMVFVVTIPCKIHNNRIYGGSYNTQNYDNLKMLCINYFRYTLTFSLFTLPVLTDYFLIRIITFGTKTVLIAT